MLLGTWALHRTTLSSLGPALDEKMSLLQGLELLLPPASAAPCPSWWEARGLLIELSNHLFKLDIWCIMIPGWGQRKPPAVLCKDQTCRTDKCPLVAGAGAALPEAELAGRVSQRVMGKGS